MASSRRNRSYKERRPMFAFGQLILPLAAIMALGLLFTGIKLFFFSPPGGNLPEPIEYVPKSVEVVQSSDNILVSSRLSDDITTEKKEVGVKKIVLAGPVDISVDTPILSADIKGKVNNKQNAVPNKKQPVNNIKKEDKKRSTVNSQSTESVKMERPEKNKPAVKPVKEKKKKEVKKDGGSDKKQQISEQKKKKEEIIKNKEKQENTSSSKSTTTSSAKGPIWGVQIGSFSKKEGADSLVLQAKKDGYATSVSRHSINGVVYFRVRVHSGTDRSKAEKMAADLGKKGYPVAVVPVN